MYIKRKPALKSPNQNFPGSWIIYLLEAIITLFFANGLFSMNGYWWSPIGGLILVALAVNMFLQSYAWYRDRHEVKVLYQLDGKKEAETNFKIVRNFKGLFSRKQK